MGLLGKLRTSLHKLRSTDRTAPVQQRVGKLGEKEAVRHLKRNRYRILERDFRVRGGEIDIVAFRHGVLVFAEVRARTRPFDFDPRYTVRKQKQARIIRAARAYAALHDVAGEDIVQRFDVIMVTVDQDGRDATINHIEAAFEA